MRRYTIKTTIIPFVLILLLGSSLILGNAVGQIDNLSSVNVASSSGVQGIWSINLKGTQQVIVTLQQDEDRLFGSAKSETERPWNAVVMGDLSENNIGLTMTSLRDKSLVSLRLAGIVHNESIKGTFVQADDQGNTEQGLFTAILINPDISAYIPAKVESVISSPTSSNNNVSQSASQTVSQPVPQSTQSQSTQPVVVGNTKYRDVRSLAGTVPESLGVGFIGDGTMGTGGMGMG